MSTLSSMPQMAPLFWLDLMVVFFLGMLVFFSFTYFISMPVKIEMTYKESESNKKV